MNKRDRARLTMAENSDQFLDNNLAEVKELPRFAETKSKLEQSIEGANEAAKDADDTDGDSDKKEAVKDELLEAAMEVITPIKLLAKFNNDPLLLNKADNPYWKSVV